VELCPYYWLAIRKVRVLRWMVSSSSDTLSFFLVTHAALFHQARLSVISCGWSQLQSNCIFYCFRGKKSKVFMFYWNIFKGVQQPPLCWWCWNWAAPFGARRNLPARLMPHSSAGLPRRWPDADAVKFQGDFVREIILLGCSTVVSVPGPRCKTSYLGFQGVQAHFLSFNWSINLWAPLGWGPDQPSVSAGIQGLLSQTESKRDS